MRLAGVRQAAPCAEGIDVATVAAHIETFEELASGAYASATARAVRADLRVWISWSVDAGAPAIGQNPETLARFVAWAGRERSAATVSRYLASIGFLHRAARLPNPAAADAPRMALKALRRAKRAPPRKAAPITASLLERILAAQPTSPKGLRDRALLLVMRDLLARRSEVAALDVGHVDLAAGTVWIASSKTDQDGDGALMWIAPETRAAIGAWLAASGHDAGPLFPPLNRAGLPSDPPRRMDGRDVARIVQDCARRAGVSALDFGPGPDGRPPRISGHSLRTGMAVELARSGFGVPQIMTAGRWRSMRSLAGYLAAESAADGAVAQWSRRRETDAP